jgi:hypothetical protein
MICYERKLIVRKLKIYTFNLELGGSFMMRV